MGKMTRNTVAALMLVSLGGLAGCATTSDLNALRAEVDKANSTANQAAADASAAKAAAEQARDAARDTNEKLDRMFKKSMYK